MSNKLFNSIGRIALASTALSFVVAMTAISLFAENPGYFNTGELLGILISLVVPILVSVPVTHYVFSKNKQLEILADQLQHSQRIDGLTGLLRRSSFYQDVTTVLDATNSQSKEHALFFIDLDNFKTINDVHGHLAGDNALKLFGKIMFDTIESGDIAGRVGGEEFCLFSPDCNADEAAEKAQLLVNSFQQQACVVDGKHIKSTISVGICLSNGNDDLDTLIKKADGRMYMAKANGKNQFVLNEYDFDPIALAA